MHETRHNNNDWNKLLLFVKDKLSSLKVENIKESCNNDDCIDYVFQKKV